jgi:hypothetical protein
MTTSFTTFATDTFASGNIVVVQSAENMVPGLPIIFSGNTFGNVTANATYYIGTITFGFPTSNITLTSLPGGAVYALADGSGNMTATFSQGGQQIIPTVPPGEPLNQAFDAINLNFDQIWAAGPVGSNIQIDQNTIYTLNTNGNLVLNPNGIGNVIANAHVIPDQDRVRNLGAPSLRWNTVYAQNFVGNGQGIANLTVSNISNGTTIVQTLNNGNVTVTVAGNSNVAVFTPDGLLINGTVSATGNITAPTFIGNLVGNITGNIDAGGANTQVQFNDNDILAGSPGFTFDKTSNLVTITGTVTAGNIVTGGTISAVGNISANYYFGNGSQLTGITADNVNADDLIGNTLSGNVLYSNLITVGNLVSLGVTGNTTTGNLSTTGYVSAIGNITGNYILGNGALLTGVITSVANINNGNSNVTISGPGSNVTVGVGGTSNVMVVSPTDVTITGNLTVTGNATLSGNILGDRIQNGNTQIDIQTTGGNANVTVGGISNVAVFATTGVFVTGVNSVSGNITGGNILTGGTVSAVGNITGNYFFGNGSQLTGITADNVNADDLIGNTLSGNVLFSSLTTVGNLVDLSVVGTTTTGNLVTTGFVSAAGNITAPTFFGNLVGNITGNIDAGGANTQIQFNDDDILAGSAAFTFDKTSNLVTVIGNVTAGNVTSQGIVTANLGVYGDIYTTSIDSADSSAVIVTPDMILLAGLDVNQDITVGNIVIPSYGNITVGNVRIANVATPIFNQDAVTKQYVDSAIGNVLPIITNQTIDPDGSSVTYILNQATTAVGILVTINGISQTPNDSYTVTGNAITFAEALLATDVVQIRFLSGSTNNGVVYTANTLPGAGAAGPGSRAFVNDSTTTSFYSIVTGGGANFVPVFSTGTVWRVG